MYAEDYLSRQHFQLHFCRHFKKYHLNESISNLMGVGDNIDVISNLNNNKYNSAESTQTPLSMASDLVLHCLLMSHKMDARL